MAYSLPENWRCINADHLFEGINEEISEINAALLMSLLDESQGDQGIADNDRLKSIIQSLEEEINPHQLTIIPQEYDDQLKGQDCLASVDTEFDWIDMDHIVMPAHNQISIPNCYMEMDLCDGDQEMEGTIEFSQLNWDSVSMDQEHEYCNSLWQQTYESVM